MVRGSVRLCLQPRETTITEEVSIRLIQHKVLNCFEDEIHLEVSASNLSTQLELSGSELKLGKTSSYYYNIVITLFVWRSRALGSEGSHPYLEGPVSEGVEEGITIQGVNYSRVQGNGA
jgi:hypothetical protein